jgi:hypothetical protein
MVVLELGLSSWEFGPVFETEARGEVRLISRKTDCGVESSNCRASAGSIEELDGWVIGEESSNEVDGGGYSSRLSHFRGLKWKVRDMMNLEMIGNLNLVEM